MFYESKLVIIKIFALTLGKIYNHSILFQLNIVMTISFSNSIEPSKIERVLQFLYREHIAFNFEPSSVVSPEDLAIRERLHNKYVQTGEWNALSLDEKEDAALLESMLFLEETGQATPLSVEDDADFKNEIKSWANL